VVLIKIEVQVVLFRPLDLDYISLLKFTNQAQKVGVKVVVLSLKAPHFLKECTQFALHLLVDPLVGGTCQNYLPLLLLQRLYPFLAIFQLLLQLLHSPSVQLSDLFVLTVEILEVAIVKPVLLLNQFLK
jgi:hypothetical protein